MTEKKKIYITPCTDDKYVYPYIVSLGVPVSTVDHPLYLGEDVEPAITRTEGHKIAQKMCEKYGLDEVVDSYTPLKKED